MGIGVGAAALVGIVLIAELGRLLLAKLFGYQAERHAIPIMKLPGMRGTTGFRLALILAGPVAGYLFVAGLAFAYAKCHGVPSDQPVVTIKSTLEGFDAHGKLFPHDVIVKIDDAPFAGGAAELTRLVTAKRGAPIMFTVRRGDDVRTVAVTPKSSELDPERKYLVGVLLQPVLETSVGTAGRHAITYPAKQAAAILKGFIDIFAGTEQIDAGGPVRIVTEFQYAFEEPSTQVLQLGAMLATYALLALAMFDLFRALFLILFRS
jgi:membrane-associated protease RseP (regulator of RpoE activity)